MRSSLSTLRVVTILPLSPVGTLTTWNTPFYVLEHAPCSCSCSDAPRRETRTGDSQAPSRQTVWPVPQWKAQNDIWLSDFARNSSSSRPYLCIVRVIWAPATPCWGASASCLRPLLGPTFFFSSGTASLISQATYVKSIDRKR